MLNGERADHQLNSFTVAADQLKPKMLTCRLITEKSEPHTRLQ
jgi:hypothetical protein